MNYLFWIVIIAAIVIVICGNSKKSTEQNNKKSLPTLGISKKGSGTMLKISVCGDEAGEKKVVS